VAALEHAEAVIADREVRRAFPKVAIDPQRFLVGE